MVLVSYNHQQTSANFSEAEKGKFLYFFRYSMLYHFEKVLKYVFFMARPLPSKMSSCVPGMNYSRKENDLKIASPTIAFFRKCDSEH